MCKNIEKEKEENQNCCGYFFLYMLKNRTDLQIVLLPPAAKVKSENFCISLRTPHFYI